MLGIIASTSSASRREVLETTNKLLEAAIEATRYDPYLEKIGIEEPIHCDGVGYTLLLVEDKKEDNYTTLGQTIMTVRETYKKPRKAQKGY